MQDAIDEEISAPKAKEIRIVLRNVGVIDPRNIEDYIANDGYQALGKVLTEMSPEDVIQEILDAKLRGRGGAVQGYNAQAACTADQVIVAAEVTQAANDVEQLAPMLAATNTTLAEAGIAARPEALVADAGYWRIENVNGSIPNAPELFIAVAKHARRGKPRKDGSPSASTSDVFVAEMKAKLKSDRGGDLMRMRRTTIEPVFGHIKDVRGARRFSRRGLDAAHAEWQLLRAAHNLTKSWRLPTRPR